MESTVFSQHVYIVLVIVPITLSQGPDPDISHGHFNGHPSIRSPVYQPRPCCSTMSH